jgi:hypothetical protein
VVIVVPGKIVLVEGPVLARAAEGFDEIAKGHRRLVSPDQSELKYIAVEDQGRSSVVIEQACEFPEASREVAKEFARLVGAGLAVVRAEAGKYAVRSPEMKVRYDDVAHTAS